MVSAPPKPNGPTGDQRGPNIPPQRGFRQLGHIYLPSNLASIFLAASVSSSGITWAYIS